jgi:hypothetical protein
LLEGLIKQFMKNMSREDKQSMMQDFMDSMTDEERTEMIQLMIPVMMRDVKSGVMIAKIVENIDENDCANMMTGMPPATREKCRRIMVACLKACE